MKRILFVFGAMLVLGGLILGAMNDGVNGAAIGALLGFMFFALIGFIIAMVKGFKIPSEPVNLPPDPLLKGIGKVLQILCILGVLMVMLYACGTEVVPRIWPMPNPAKISQTDCAALMRIVGFSDSTKCPKTAEEVRPFVESYTEPLSSDRDWQSELTTALLGNSCPASVVGMRGKPACKLEIDSFNIKFQEYSLALRKQTDERWHVAGLEVMIGIQALLGLLNYLWAGIALAGLMKRPKWKIGKVTATTVFALAIVAAFMLNPIVSVFGSVSMTSALWQLFLFGFLFYPATVLLGVITFLINKLTGILKKITQNAVNMFIAILVFLGAMLLVVAGEILGWLPSLGQIIVVASIMDNNPGLTLKVALMAVFLGSTAFSGLFGALVGPAWTFVTSIISAMKNAEAADKLGF